MSATAAELAGAAAGLLMPSESDYPFEPFVWLGPVPLTPEALVGALGLPPETPVELRSLERLFAPLTYEQEWMDAEERARCARFAELRALIEARLTDPCVYWVGVIQIGVFIVGQDASGACVGLRTTVIAT